MIAVCKNGMNQEYLIIVIHYIAVNTSLLFVHTARRIKERSRSNEASGSQPLGWEKLVKSLSLDHDEVVTRYS